jgi:hypothetical protein
VAGHALPELAVERAEAVAMTADGASSDFQKS